MKPGSVNWVFAAGLALITCGAVLLLMGLGGVALKFAGPMDLTALGVLSWMFAAMFLWGSNYIIIECPRCHYRGEQDGN